MTRLILRILVYLLATFAIALVIGYAALIVGIYVFDSPTTECTGSDTCDAFGDFLYDLWPGQVLCLLLGAVVAWRVLPVRR